MQKNACAIGARRDTVLVVLYKLRYYVRHDAVLSKEIVWRGSRVLPPFAIKKRRTCPPEKKRTASVLQNLAREARLSLRVPNGLQSGPSIHFGNAAN